MKRYMVALARAMVEAGARHNMKTFASIWADALELHSVVSEFAAALPTNRAGRYQALAIEVQRMQYAGDDQTRYDVLVRIMAAAAWAAMPIAAEKKAVN